MRRCHLARVHATKSMGTERTFDTQYRYRRNSLGLLNLEVFAKEINILRIRSRRSDHYSTCESRSDWPNGEALPAFPSDLQAVATSAPRTSFETSILQGQGQLKLSHQYQVPHDDRRSVSVRSGTSLRRYSNSLENDVLTPESRPRNSTTKSRTTSRVTSRLSRTRSGTGFLRMYDHHLHLLPAE